MLTLTTAMTRIQISIMNSNITRISKVVNMHFLTNDTFSIYGYESPIVELLCGDGKEHWQSGNLKQKARKC